MIYTDSLKRNQIKGGPIGTQQSKCHFDRDAIFIFCHAIRNFFGHHNRPNETRHFVIKIKTIH